ncbi:ISL3 family transposase [Bacillus smithii]|uniref:ISL3 family transposase n=2 Tax=Bacillus smithii TaxID=1479 RepID=UPI00065E5F38|nr:ISL3 family transposase [Bacillus smithii]AKP47313.1 Mobile element protein [Bacillus smithii]
MHSHFITKLLGLEDVEITHVEDQITHFEIHIQTPVKVQKCPCCQKETSSVHDDRIQKIRDVKVFEKYCFLILRKRRYRCKSCGKRFYEPYSFLERYQRHTKRLLQALLVKVREYNFKQVAKETGLGHSTVIRLFDKYYSYDNKALPKVLAIDELKGTSETGKYQCIIGDPVNRRVYDIIPNRNLSTLKEYFRTLPREKVQMVVMDMWQPYKTLALKSFDKPILVVDRFHYVRHNVWALERVRKRVQKNFQEKDRKSMKKLRYLLHKPHAHLNADEMEQLNYFFSLALDLKKAYIVKETFHKWLKESDKTNAKRNLEHLYKVIEESGLEEYQYMKRTFKNWEKEILNSFLFPYTNGFIEGINNKIKVIKRMSYGIRNFKRLRNKALCSLI